MAADRKAALNLIFLVVRVVFDFLPGFEEFLRTKKNATAGATEVHTSFISGEQERS